MVRVVVGFALLGAWVGCSAPSLLVGQDPVETNGGADGNGTDMASGGTDMASGGTTGPGGGARVSRTVSLFTNQIRISPDDPDGLAIKCLPFALDPTEDGTVEARVIVVTPPGDCACNSPVTTSERAAAAAYMASVGYCKESDPDFPCSGYCMCEMGAATGEARQGCLEDAQVPGESQGYCYLSEAPAIGNPELFADCNPSDKQALRFLGLPTDGLAVVLAADVVETPTATPARHLALGAACLPEVESDPTMSGFVTPEVAIETGSASCDSGLCVVNHFQGRVSCPFGQGEADNTPDQACFVPYSDEAVTVPVRSQLTHRTAKQVATCSCQCAGPGDGPFCTCPSSMECLPLIAETGLPSSDAMAGSYCVRRSTEYNPADSGIYTGTCTNPSIPAEADDCGDPRPY